MVYVIYYVHVIIIYYYYYYYTLWSYYDLCKIKNIAEEERGLVISYYYLLNSYYYLEGFRQVSWQF